ncbi:permease [Streptococcus equi]|uniref:Putative permease n=2 Tax=Streptococcus equi TaxID=1336 RepID=C0M8I4_STRE4|nr:permease [Streptococcus equi]ASB97170.1 permease [Streptococcus equi subsp. equi]MBT1195453.1 permease [Streptococcus equi subsp. equi]MBT1196708.1 permease [Streptococcus equi subsp. equi]MBT1199453.1 permease [Streptococcus equi subsp. equi]MBT1201290.1 permease [Streptococcus equi subsp. equi]
MSLFSNLPPSVLQWFAIFLSIIIEALPFVFLGTILSGCIEVFVTPDLVQRYLPQNKWLRILFGTFIGFVFPSCECGIIPIINRFLEKKVPSYTAVPFLATAPIINPIVLFATYSAFGNSLRFLMLRLLGAILVAVSLGIMLAFIVDENILKESTQPVHCHTYSHESLPKRLYLALAHAIDEFFDTGRYLVFGTLIASAMQIYLPTKVLTAIGHSPLTAILVMMLLAFILSLCSEADAFIGASLLSTFGVAPVLAFLLIGPMVDIKNLMMMLNSFKGAFIVQFISVSAVMITIYCLLVGVL